jgi:hypothetical protein
VNRNAVKLLFFHQIASRNLYSLEFEMIFATFFLSYGTLLIKLKPSAPMKPSSKPPRLSRNILSMASPAVKQHDTRHENDCLGSLLTACCSQTTFSLDSWENILETERLSKKKLWRLLQQAAQTDVHHLHDYVRGKLLLKRLQHKVDEKVIVLESALGFNSEGAFHQFMQRTFGCCVKQVKVNLTATRKTFEIKFAAFVALETGSRNGKSKREVETGSRNGKSKREVETGSRNGKSKRETCAK